MQCQFSAIIMLPINWPTNIVGENDKTQGCRSCMRMAKLAYAKSVPQSIPFAF